MRICAALLISFIFFIGSTASAGRLCLLASFKGPLAGLELVEQTEWKFSVYDPESMDYSNGGRGQAKLYFVAKRTFDNELELFAKSVDEDGNRSKYLKAAELFALSMQHFKNQRITFKAINGEWVYGTNLKTFNELTQNGMAAEKAAQETWTGTQAAKYGYTRVRVLETRGPAGNYDKVRVQFLLPK